jgi:hypothetical protein
LGLDLRQAGVDDRVKCVVVVAFKNYAKFDVIAHALPGYRGSLKVDNCAVAN